jgi:hypothetical protein
MKQVFLCPSKLDPITWSNYKDNNIIWKKTEDIDKCDYIFYIDNAIKIKSSKPKILFLVEPEEVLKLFGNFTYDNIIHDLEPDIIVTYYKQLQDGEKYFYSQAPLNSWISTPNIYKKNKLCSIIASRKAATYGQQLRHLIVNRFKNSMDLYGNGYKPIIKKEEGLIDYCFSFAIENCIVPGYFSEKILDCFLTGTVPIYYGDPSIGDIFDTRGIIFLRNDFDIKNLTFECYKNMLPYVQENYNRTLLLNPSFEKYFCSGIKHYESKFINSSTSI